MKVKLVVGQGPHKGKEIPVVTSAKFFIGRSTECQLKANSQAISKKHCAIAVRDGKCYVEDLNSTNGTFLNEEPFKGEREVHDGDMLKIGPLDFTVKLVGAAAPAVAPVHAPAPPPQAEVPTHVEKQTKKAPPSRPGPKPSSETPTSSGLDDDTIGSMLLDLDEGVRQGPSMAEEKGAENTTMMDMLVPEKEDTGVPAPYHPKDVKQKETPASTSKAAQDILEKYRRRPRS